MIYAEIEWYKFDVTTLTQEQWARACQLWPGVHSELAEMSKREAEQRKYTLTGEHRLTLEEAFELEQMGFQLTYRGIDGTMLTKMQDRGSREAWDRPSATEILSGKTVQIAIPDLGLLVIDEVTNIDDACTDVLQDHLKDGWRILAVCPPNAARRPDYILGRQSRRG